jgi:hypothetical protein
MMMTNKEFEDFIHRPPLCLKDTCHSVGTQQTYDRRPHELLIQGKPPLHAPDLLLKHDEGQLYI